MNKNTLCLTSLVAAVPGAVLAVLMVMAFVNFAGGWSVMVKGLTGLLLLIGAALAVMPVGIFLFVASLLFGASTALLNAPEKVRPIIPLTSIQYWCLPVTFSTLAVIGVFMSLILIRTRIGLIYEVAKMNELLGLPSERVKRVNPLSIFFLMHLLVVVLGAASSGFAWGMLLYHWQGDAPTVWLNAAPVHR